MAEDQPTALLKRFAESGVVEQKAAFAELLSLKKRGGALNDPLFLAGIQRLGTLAVKSREDDGLLAIALLQRIAAAHPPSAVKAAPLLRSAVVEQPGDFQRLRDAQDRTYLGDVVTELRPEWAAVYSANAIVREDVGENVRKAFAKALIRSRPSLEEAFRLLNETFSEWARGPQSQPDAVARRLRRIAGALREALKVEQWHASLEAAKQLAALVRTGVKAPTEETELAIDLSDEFGSLTLDISRSRMSLSFDPTTYAPLVALSNSQRSRWKAVTSRAGSFPKVRDQLLEAILVLGRQSVIAGELFDILVTCVGDRGAAQERLRPLAAEAGLPEPVRSWFSTGEVNPSDSTAALEDAGSVEQLAELLVRCNDYASGEPTLKQRVAELEFIQPHLFQQVRRMMDSGLSLCDLVRRLASGSRLRLRGSIGGEEKYSPLDHLASDGRPISTASVRLVQPAVEQLRTDGTPYVVRRALVDPLPTKGEP